MRNLLFFASIALIVSTSAHGGSCCQAVARPARSVLPDTSIYNHSSAWRDQRGESRVLADFAGTPVLVTMVFSHCGYACPRTLDDIRAMVDAMPANTRRELKVVLVSFDVERDVPERLAAWAEQQKLGEAWTLLHGDALAVRELAVLLDIAFQKQPDGSFAHANRVLLLDRSGVPVASMDGLGASPSAILEGAAKMAAVAR